MIKTKEKNNVQIFLGAFGNRSFICPQYEIMEDGSLREMRDSRWTRYRNQIELFMMKKMMLRR